MADKDPNKIINNLTNEPLDDIKTISDDGNFTLYEWFKNNSHWLEGDQENRDIVINAILSNFSNSNIDKKQAEKYYDLHFKK